MTNPLKFTSPQIHFLTVGPKVVQIANKVVLIHSVHWGINPPSKLQPPISCQAPPLNLQTVQAPLFR